MASPILGGSTASAAINAPIFQQDCFSAHQSVFSWRSQFYFRDLNGNTLAFLRKKAFSWKDEIRVFTDESLTLELLTIKARKIIDWGSAFDVTDSINHQKVGVLKRQGWKSLLRSEWIIADANDQEIGVIRESSGFMAVLHRFVSNLLPQTYKFEIRGNEVGRATQKLSFFVPRMEADFSADPGRQLDRRLTVAAIVLLMSVEARQSV